jgi:hypothetical protein
MILDNSSEGSEGIVILSDILNKQDMRCDNKSCDVNNKCKRHKQHLIDVSKNNTNEVLCKTFSDETFIREGFDYEKDCNYFLRINK